MLKVTVKFNATVDFMPPVDSRLKSKNMLPGKDLLLFSYKLYA
jgi:hypothetical protein